MALKEYRKKRNFSASPEPKGKPRKRAGWTFVVQAHDASRLHYDFRLQLEGVLKSWAVPKGPSLNPADKRLAVEVEDHPIEYARFEGVIPEGEYGGGTVMLWDTGQWKPLDDDPAKALRHGKLDFTLDGERLHGDWTLARMRSRDGDGHDWLLIKKKDTHAGKRSDPLKMHARSVKSGRSLEEIAADEDTKEWRSGRPQRRTKKKPQRSRGAHTKRAAPQRPRGIQHQSRARKEAETSTPPRPREIDPARLVGAKKAAMPRALKPQLATLVDLPPDGDDWLHEIKLDGYRLICHRSRSSVRLMTRRGKDWTKRFAPIAKAIAELPVDSAVIDGEAAIVEASGHTSFQSLQQSMKEQRFERLAFFAFDLVYCDGYDLTRTPQRERKALLRELLPAGDDRMLRYSDHIVGHGEKFYAQACEQDLEGVISKRADSRYREGRTRNWLKIKCNRRQEFVIIGWSPPSGTRKHFGALVLAAHDNDGRLRYVGRVGTGFSTQALKDIADRMKRIERQTSPADGPPPRSESRGVRWVRPELVAEVRFSEWTDDGRLRQPAFQGLREDKDAAKVNIEIPMDTEHVAEAGAASSGQATKARSHGGTKRQRGRGPQSDQSRGRKPPDHSADHARKSRSNASKVQRSRRSSSGSDQPVVAGVRLSNADRVLYPEQDLTKLDLAKYYERVADQMMPYIENRPLSTVRCPKGRAQKCFFQKHLGETFGPPVRGIRVREKSGNVDYLGVDSIEGLIALVQFGVLEIHPWGAKADRLDTPDVMTFDLDPGENVGFAAVKDGARRIREILLEKADLDSFLKTSGGKGLHVVVPLARRANWDEVKDFAHAVAKKLAKDDPDHFIATASKQKRRGRIFVDYLRNSRGATSIAPWSTRARPHAPVSIPIRWDELGKLNSAAQYTIESAVQRLSRLKKDPWEGFSRTRQDITPGRLKIVREAT